MGVYVTQLAELRTAISQVLTNGQSTGFNGQSLSKADLGTLYAEQKRLEPLAFAEEQAALYPGRGRNRIIRVSV